MSSIDTEFLVQFDDVQKEQKFISLMKLIERKKYKEMESVIDSNYESNQFIHEDDVTFEVFEKKGGIVQGSIESGTLSFEEEDFKAFIKVSGARYALVSHYYSQIGESTEYALKNGKRYGKKKLLDEISKIKGSAN